MDISLGDPSFNPLIIGKFTVSFVVEIDKLTLNFTWR